MMKLKLLLKEEGIEIGNFDFNLFINASNVFSSKRNFG